MSNVGILGVGVYLPPIVRTNDWWPQPIVDEWVAKQQRNLTRAAAQDDGELTPGARITIEAMSQFKNDPFEGVKERRIMPDDMRSSDMEIAAARDAIERSGIDPAEIDIVLVQTTTPDWLHVPTAVRVHRELGIRRDCYTLQTDGMCNAFLQQLVLAEGLLKARTGRYALIVQACAMNRHLKREDQFSAWFGDAATAAVVGLVSGDHGVLAHSHATDGSVYGSIVTGVPQKRWYDGGEIRIYLESARAARDQFLMIADAVKPLVEDCLAKTQLSKQDVKFFACHQASAWLGRAAQRHTGLDNAVRVDTFPWASSVSGCNLPLVLATGEREGLLHSGDLVAMFSGAAGMTVSALLVRWGR